MNTRRIFASALRVGDEVVRSDESSFFIEQAVYSDTYVTAITEDGGQEVFFVLDVVTVRLSLRKVLFKDTYVGDYVVIPCPGDGCRTSGEEHGTDHRGFVVLRDEVVTAKRVETSTLKAWPRSTDIVQVDWHRA